MKNFLCFFYLFLTFFPGIVVADESVLRTQLKAEVDEVVTGFLGSTEGFSTVIDVTRKEVTPTSPDDSGNFSGYLPRPMTEVTTSSLKDFRSTVTVMLFKPIENPEDLKAHLAVALKQYGSVIQVKTASQARVTEPNQQPKIVPEKKAEKPNETSVWEKILQDPEQLLRLLSILVISSLALVCIGLFFLISRTLINGLTKAVKDFHAHGKLPAAEGDQKGHPDPRVDSLLNKSLVQLQALIELDPKRFTHELRATNELDVRGFRKLLSIIDPHTQRSFKGNLTEDFISAVKSTQKLPLNDAEFVSWSCSMFERVGLSTLEDLSFYESVLGETLLRNTIALGEEKLIEYALSDRSGPGLKLVLDLLNPAARKSLLSQLNSKDWEKLVGERFCTPEEILKVANEITAVDKGGGKKLDLPPSLLEASVQLALEAEFLQEESLIESMFGSNPALRGDFLTQFVPLSSLSLVDEMTKKASFLSLGNPVKISVLAGLPEQERETFLVFLPEGKSKILILDGLKKALAADENARISSRLEAKKFVQSFRAYILKKRKDQALKLVS